MDLTNDTPCFADIAAASKRLETYIKSTPILSSQRLNQWLGHTILFKGEPLQLTGAFKIRGALNTLLKLKEANALPPHVVCSSSGNHAQAVAYASKIMGVDCTVYCPRTISAVKRQATEDYGANIVLCDNRQQADELVKQHAAKDNVFWLPPYNHPDVIAGQGSLALDSFKQLDNITLDAVAAPCGGGGLLSGTYISSQQYFPHAAVIGAEPELGNDAVLSRQQGKIVTLQASPNTLADGAATLSLGNYTFPFIQQLDALYPVSESRIAYWTQWLHHLLKIHVEPTCAMTMEAVTEWLQHREQPSTILVLLSGGNISTRSMQRIWADDHLTQPPVLKPK